MTARHQIRVGSRLGRGRSPIDATAAPTVGEMLQAARERKGVDLHRAERDTKIRAKHLAALENGDYDELPGTVYARGFLRNYAIYLGLDADEVVADWREEQEAVAPIIREPIAMPPQPMVEPKGHLRFTRQVFIGALLVLVVVGFLGYVGIQLLRFNHPPTLTLDQAPVQTLSVDATSFTFSGKVDMPAAIVAISGPGGFGQTTPADANGRWTIQVPVTKGQNDFTISARDPQLPPDKGSTPLAVRLIVPIPATPTPLPQPSGSGAPLPSGGVGPGASAAPGSQLPAAVLTIQSPTDGAQLTAGTIVVSGTTNASSVNVLAGLVGPPGVQPSPNALQTEPPGTVGSTVAATVSGGTFTVSIPLTPGRWDLHAMTPGDAGVTDPADTVISVDVLPADGLVLDVSVTNKAAWIKVIADGTIVEPGRTFRRSESTTYTAKVYFIVTTGNAGSTDFVLNGKDFGTLGGDGLVQNWRFEKGKQPRRV